jgi:hypothetical protein
VAIGSAIYRPHWIFILPLLWSFGILCFLIDSFERGSLTDNAGTFLRNQRPLLFWFRASLWIMGLLFMLGWPIGFAIQESQKTALPSVDVLHK